MIEPPAAGEIMPAGELILGRPPTDPEAEMALLKKHAIGWIVSKDSGGQAGAKIVAARRLGLPVVLVERPPRPPGRWSQTVDAAIAWIEATLFARRLIFTRCLLLPSNARPSSATDQNEVTMPEDRSDRLAVLIDADNASSQIADGLFEEIAKIGEASVRRIYGDFAAPAHEGLASVLSKHAIIPQQQFAYTTGKNASDIALVIDAMDLLHSGRFDGFCLVSSDSDFTRLAARIREQGIDVYGFGEQKTPESFRQACRRFIYTENLRPRSSARATQTAPVHSSLQPPSAAAPILRKVISQMDSEDGWVTLAAFGQHARQSRPRFRFAHLRLQEAERSRSQIQRIRRRSRRKAAACAFASSRSREQSLEPQRNSNDQRTRFRPRAAPLSPRLSCASQTSRKFHSQARIGGS